MSIQDLIERLEKATGPDRELDEDIAHAVGVRSVMQWDHEACGGDGSFEHMFPRYTYSIDAALTLVPEGWEWRIDGGYLPDRHYACVMNMGLVSEPQFTVDKTPSTPAIALCIAALKARQAMTIDKDS